MSPRRMSPRALARYSLKHDTVERHRHTVVPLAAARLARDWLRAEGQDVAWPVYPMAHEIIGAEIADLNVWLVERLVY